VYDGSYLKGKRVLLTGANRGLGMALAKQLVEDGAAVIAVGRVPCEVPGIAQNIKDVDVCDTAAVQGMTEQIKEPVDIVINNAGIFWPPEGHETLADGLNFDMQLKQIDVCAVAPLRVSSLLHKAGKLKRDDQSSVIIISSQAGSTEWRFTQNPTGGDYGHHMSRASCNIGAVLLAQELKAEGIPVVMLHPGFNRTEMTSKFKEIWDLEGAVDASEGAKRVLHEIKQCKMAKTGLFINCEDGLQIPW